MATMKMWWCIFGIIPVLVVLQAQEIPICPDICECDYYQTNCRNNDLAVLPTGINPDVSILDISYNNFKEVPADLRNYRSLKYLNISYNKISSLGHSDFRHLVKLQLLDVSNNLFHDWKDIHSETFSSLRNLTYLDFSNNPLRSIPQYSNHLIIISLEILRLTNCSMKTFPLLFVNNLINLKELHLNNNPLNSLNDTFDLDNLKYIDLSQCNLHYIDPNTFTDARALETLIIKNNPNLKRFSCNSESLLYLDLSDCALERIPNGHLRSLTTLDLKGNFLKRLNGNSFRNSTNLIQLNLSYNAISSIDFNAFSDLQSVQFIDLSINKLTSLNDELFSSTTSLVVLNLSHNYLTSVDISSPSLKTLDMSFCEIYEIDRFSLESLPNLMDLKLSRNFFSTLPDRWYADQLAYLDLSNCRIRSLNNKTFSQIYRLVRLNLSGNQLTTIDPSYFPRAMYVNIENNQWRCDCPKLKDTYEWLVEYNERVDNLFCETPEKHAGKTWRAACQDEWYPTLKQKDRLWWYSVGVVITMIILLFGVIVVRKVYQLKEKRLRDIEEERRAQEREALQRMRRLQIERREEADRNAPDPRELHQPPSYNEALLLPKLDASHPSLSGSMHSIASRQSGHGSTSDISKKGRARRKRRRRKSDASESRRASRVVVDSDTSDQGQQQIQAQPPLESDF